MINNIRNFVIIAHIDHGKSTLADRMLEITRTVQSHRMKDQYLDSHELERERGITIRMAPVRMIYHPSLEIRNSKFEIPDSGFILNLIDTPGHSDFSYEVSRSLKAVEGAILLVDATQGIQAQTLANLHFAEKAGLKIIGALNKVDMNPNGVDELAYELASLISVEPEEIHRISGKTGFGVPGLLDAIVEKVPPPQSSLGKSALIFSSQYDNHKGVVAFVRVFGGKFNVHDGAKLVAANADFKIKELGYFSPEFTPSQSLEAGEIGYIATGIKDSNIIRVGDTIGDTGLPGFKIPAPVVFVSIYPDDASDYENLKIAIGKLQLNDSSLTFQSDMSEVLGRGFRCGFLGRLHFEITMQRLEREFNLEVVNSFPSVSYKVKFKSLKDLPNHLSNRIDENGYVTIENPKDLPGDYIEVLEPITRIEVLMPSNYMGAFLGLKDLFRFSEVETTVYGLNGIRATAKLPLSELILDFDDKLKSATSGFASFSYEMIGYEKTQVKRLDIHVAEEPVTGLSRILYDDNVEAIGRQMLVRLKDLLPQQQFSQALQAVIGGKIVARETIPAMQKNLGDFGKNGGDRTRKMKLWKKQKEGKVRLKEMGKVHISPEIFKELLKK